MREFAREFREVSCEFREVFRKFFEVFGLARASSDVFGWIRMSSDASPSPIATSGSQHGPPWSIRGWGVVLPLFDKYKKELFISAKVAKALNLKSGSLAQVN